MAASMNFRRFGGRLYRGCLFNVNSSRWRNPSRCLAFNITAAGEMNGFLTLRQPLLPGLLGFEKGCAVLASAPMPVPDKELLESLAIDKASFC